MTAGTARLTEREKAKRWDDLISLLGQPEIRNLTVRHISKMRRATGMLLANREELPATLTAELVSYKSTLDELYLEAIDGFADVEGVINLLPTYVTESTVAELCQPDTATNNDADTVTADCTIPGVRRKLGLPVAATAQIGQKTHG
jgi:hypothetical protein